MMTKFPTSWKDFPCRWKSRMNKKLTNFIFKKDYNSDYWVFVSRTRHKSCLHSFILDREWGYLSESNVKVHRYLHFNKKPLSVAQYNKDVIKIMLLLDGQLSIQLLFCKTGQDRLHKRLRKGMNSLPWNIGSSKLISPVVENVELKGTY